MQIFINYRVADTGGYAWALYYRLARRFGAENVCLDKAAVRPGTPWFDQIKTRASRANVFLARVGPVWGVSIVDHMRRRANDVLVSETSQAIRARAVEVISVLVNAAPPDSGMLPRALKPLFELQSMSLNVDMHNASFAEESLVEGACDRLDFWRDRQRIAW